MNEIKLQNIHKRFGKKQVLEDISFEVPKGKFCTLIGCNGAGKSTLLRVIAGLEKCEKGSVSSFGEDPSSKNFKKKKEIFFIHEGYNISHDGTLLDFLKIYRSIYPKWSNSTFNKMLKDRKLSLKKKFSSLSRGQKMQFLIMVALAANVKTLLLDEITSVIDIEAQRYYLELLKDYTRNGGTVLITTNILSELNSYTDHLFLMQEKELKINAPVSEMADMFVILKENFHHKIFEGEDIASIGKDRDGKELYLISRKKIQEADNIEGLLTGYTPSLEDILALYFKLKDGILESEGLAA